MTRYAIRDEVEFLERFFRIVTGEFPELTLCPHWWTREEFEVYCEKVVRAYEADGWHACIKLAIHDAAAQIVKCCFEDFAEEAYVEHPAYLRALAIVDGREP